MKKLVHLLFLTIFVNFYSYSNAQTVNNATVNMTGNVQNVFITQSGAGHNVNVQLFGDNVPVNISQTGSTPNSFNLSITCYSNCAASPTNVTQY